MMKYTLFVHNSICKELSTLVKIESEEFEIQTHRLRLGSRLFLPGEKKTALAFCVRLEFLLMGNGKTEIYYCTNKQNEIIHTSILFPRCFKFPFLSENDYCIGGPCFTKPEYREKGIYLQVLNYIMSCSGNQNSKFYMVVNPDNEPSIRGVQKAGFQRCGEAYITKLKQFKRA